MGLFSNSSGNEYILVCVNCMSKWVEAIPTRMNETRVSIRLLHEKIFVRYGMPSAIISDQGAHFDDNFYEALLSVYSIIHRLTALYHPQTNDQVKVFSK